MMRESFTYLTFSIFVSIQVHHGMSLQRENFKVFIHGDRYF